MWGWSGVFSMHLIFVLNQSDGFSCFKILHWISLVVSSCTSHTLWMCSSCLTVAFSCWFLTQITCSVCLLFKGSEEVFSVDPLPPRTQSPDQVHQSSPYVPDTSRVEITEPDPEAPGDRDEEEMLPVDMEEVSSHLQLTCIENISRSGVEWALNSFGAI